MQTKKYKPTKCEFPWKQLVPCGNIQCSRCLASGLGDESPYFYFRSINPDFIDVDTQNRIIFARILSSFVLNLNNNP